jgi:hypothetical protein
MKLGGIFDETWFVDTDLDVAMERIFEVGSYRSCNAIGGWHDALWWHCWCVIGVVATHMPVLH